MVKCKTSDQSIRLSETAETLGIKTTTKKSLLLMIIRSQSVLFNEAKADRL